MPFSFWRALCYKHRFFLNAAGTHTMTWQPELDELRAREAFAKQMGGADKVKRQHDGGRLTVRERIDAMLDAGSFHEVGAITGKADYDSAGKLKNLQAANCVFGRGTVDGRPVVICGDDFTVRGGSADATIKEKTIMAEQMAHEFRLPIIRAVSYTHLTLPTKA